MRAMRGGRCCCSVSQRRDGTSFFQKRVPEERAGVAADDGRQHAERHDVGRARRRRRRARRRGRSTSAASASTCGRRTRTIPSIADELRIDLDPSPGHRRSPMVAARRRARCGRCSTSSASIGMPKTTGNRGIHIYVAARARWDSYEVRAAAVARGARARAPPARPDHRGLVEGGARRARLRRLQPERAAQDGVRRVVGAAARRRAGVDAVLAGTSSTTIDPDELTLATVPDRVATDGDPWAEMPTQPQSLEPLLAMHERDLAAGLLDAPWPPVYPKMPERAAARGAVARAQAGRGHHNPTFGQWCGPATRATMDWL